MHRQPYINFFDHYQQEESTCGADGPAELTQTGGGRP